MRDSPWRYKYNFIVNYRAIGFDYAGVLVSIQSRMQGISEIVDLPTDELRKVYFQNNALFNINEVPYHEFWRILLRKIGKEEKSDEVLRYVVSRETQTINNDMVALLDRLRSLKFKVGLLSNNSKGAAAKMRQEGFGEHVDVLMVSAEVGYQKPSPEIFRLFAEKLGVRTDELIFIDDSKQSLSLADEIGFHPILFTSYDNLVREFTSLGVLPY